MDFNEKDLIFRDHHRSWEPRCGDGTLGLLLYQNGVKGKMENIEATWISMRILINYIFRPGRAKRETNKKRPYNNSQKSIFFNTIPPMPRVLGGKTDS